MHGRLAVLQLGCVPASSFTFYIIEKRVRGFACVRRYGYVPWRECGGWRTTLSSWCFRLYVGFGHPTQVALLQCQVSLPAESSHWPHFLYNLGTQKCAVVVISEICFPFASLLPCDCARACLIFLCLNELLVISR